MDELDAALREVKTALAQARAALKARPTAQRREFLEPACLSCMHASPTLDWHEKKPLW